MSPNEPLSRIEEDRTMTHVVHRRFGQSRRSICFLALSVAGVLMFGSPGVSGKQATTVGEWRYIGGDMHP